MMLFLTGLLTGGLGVWLLYAGKRRKLRAVEEEKQLLQQEKQIVVEFMHNMVEAVAEGNDRETMFQRIVHAAILSTGAMSACIFEKRDDDTLKGVAVEGLFPPQRKLPPATSSKMATRSQFLENILRSESYRMGEGLIGSVAKARRALLIADARSDPRVVQHDDPALQVRSMIVAPVLFRDTLIGVLAVANPSDGLAFTDTDFSLVESLAEQVGLAVHNSDAMQLQIEKNKLDLDLELASNIQSLLLPAHFPTCEAIEFATHYTPAQKVGGDLFDVFSLGDGRIGLAIADVSGKGVAASILMAICQTNLRHISRREDSPAAVLRAINAEMQQSMRRDMFITIIYAIIDPAADRVTVARAGHEPPIHNHAEGGGAPEPKPVRASGMALGMVPPALFDPAIDDLEIPFNSGDSLLFYTDGVTESVNTGGEEYSSGRLIELLQQYGGESAQSIIDHVMDSVRRFASNTGQLDDFTLIAVKHD